MPVEHLRKSLGEAALVVLVVTMLVGMGILFYDSGTRLETTRAAFWLELGSGPAVLVDGWKEGSSDSPVDVRTHGWAVFDVKHGTRLARDWYATSEIRAQQPWPQVIGGEGSRVLIATQGRQWYRDVQSGEEGDVTSARVAQRPVCSPTPGEHCDRRTGEDARFEDGSLLRLTIDDAGLLVVSRQDASGSVQWTWRSACGGDADVFSWDGGFVLRLERQLVSLGSGGELRWRVVAP